jgi:hypothetical protein
LDIRGPNGFRDDYSENAISDLLVTKVQVICVSAHGNWFNRGEKMKTIVSIFAVLALGAGIAAKPNKKNYCKKEVAGSMRGQKAECAKQRTAALKTAGKDKAKREEAKANMSSCMMMAEESGKSMMESCMSASPEAN